MKSREYIDGFNDAMCCRPPNSSGWNIKDYIKGYIDGSDTRWVLVLQP